MLTPTEKRVFDELIVHELPHSWPNGKGGGSGIMTGILG